MRNNIAFLNTFIALSALALVALIVGVFITEGFGPGIVSVIVTAVCFYVFRKSIRKIK